MRDEPRTPPPAAKLLALLPVWLLGAMVIIAVVLESQIYGTVQWQGKSLLVGLIAWLGWRLHRR